MKQPKTGSDAAASGDLGLGAPGSGAGDSSQDSPPNDGSGKPPPTREDLDAALAALPDDHNTDADYVARAMRSHFGDLFTDADEARVRELVVAPDPAGKGKQPAPDGKGSGESKAAAGPKLYRFTQRVECGDKDGKRIVCLPEDPPRSLSKQELKDFAGLVEEVKTK